MVKANALTTPIATKIKTVVDAFLTAKTLPKNVDVIDYEPSEMMANTITKDGVIAVYFRKWQYVSGSTTGTQQGSNELHVDCWGIGDPIKNQESDVAYNKSIREAQKRAEILKTLAYNAIMDRAEVVNNFGTAIEIDSKLPVSSERFSPFGAAHSARGVCLIKNIYKFEIEEDPPTEALGADYSGSDWITETYNE